jgi:hypothetical protein
MHDEDETSNLVRHAMRELDLLGMPEDADDVDKLGRDGVLELVRVFANQGHSGGSAPWMIDVVERLLRFEPLTDLTDDPDEWMHIAEEMAGEPNLYQSIRKPSAFSHDGGQTYYLLEERDLSPETTPLHRSVQKETK